MTTQLQSLKAGYMHLQYGKNYEVDSARIIKKIKTVKFNYPVEISLLDPKQQYDKIITPFHDDWSKAKTAQFIFENKKMEVENSLDLVDIFDSGDIRRKERFLICQGEYCNCPKVIFLEEKGKPITGSYKVDISIFGLDKINDAHVVLNAINYNDVSIHNFFISQYVCGSVHIALWLETMFENGSGNLSRAIKHIKEKERNIKINKCGTCWPSRTF